MSVQKYDNDDGVPQDKAKAVELYEQAAKQGVVEAQQVLQALKQ